VVMVVSNWVLVVGCKVVVIDFWFFGGICVLCGCDFKKMLVIGV
ncbi:4'-phosphopantetheinyl transferase, partial [Enterococcus hirae]